MINPMRLVEQRYSVFLVLIAAGCGDSTGPTTGSALFEITTAGARIDSAKVTGTLTVTIVTNVDFDPNGYRLSVDGAAPMFVPGVFPGYKQAVVVPALTVGSHTVSMSGVAVHCTASPSSAISFTVSPRAAQQVSFAVVCMTHEVSGYGGAQARKPLLTHQLVR